MCVCVRVYAYVYQTGVCDKEPERAMTVNGDGTKHVVDAICKLKETGQSVKQHATGNGESVHV